MPNPKITHKEYANGKWFTLTLCEQLGNVGSEVERLIRWKSKGNEEFAENALFRALELLDLTRRDPRWKKHRFREIARVREYLCHAYYDEALFDVNLEYLQKYFMDFALAARKNR